jgi:hypothetical protein
MLDVTATGSGTSATDVSERLFPSGTSTRL